MRQARNIRLRTRFGGTALTAGVVLLAASVAAARGDELRPGIIGSDDRTILTETGPPWDAVGQVNVGGFRTSGQCTGTLVAPGIVITAAHCIVDAATGRPFPLRNVHFLAAVRGSDHKGHSTAACLRFLDGYGGAGSGNSTPVSSLVHDAAVIVLDETVAVEPAPLAELTAVRPGLELSHVAYPGDRRFAPVVHKGCRLLGTAPEGPFWFNDCDTHPGSSGGPVFVEEDGAYRVAAIQVAAGPGGFNLALPIEVWAGLIEPARCP